FVTAPRFVDVDFALLAGEAQRVPFLLLAAIFALPRLFCDLAGQIVGEPLGDFAKLLHGADAGFLVQLTQCSGVWVFVLVDPALRHLPDMGGVDMFGSIGSPADKDKPGTIDHHHPGARAIRQRFLRRHLDSRYFLRAILRRRNNVTMTWP